MKISLLFIRWIIIASFCFFVSGCSKEQLKKSATSSIYNLTQAYDCEKSAYGPDADAHNERCGAKALGGNRVSYDEYKKTRQLELAGSEPKSVDSDDPIKDVFIGE